MINRKTIQDSFIRIAQDSGFTMSSIDVAIFTGRLLGCSPFTVYEAFGDMDVMNAVANGTHPASRKGKK